MKKFILLYMGTRRKPSPEDMEKIKKWFEILGDKIVDSGNPLVSETYITQSGVNETSHGDEEIVGYSIINAESVEEIEKISKDCPTNIKVLEALPM
jgi:hypothetical protein